LNGFGALQMRFRGILPEEKSGQAVKNETNEIFRVVKKCQLFHYFDEKYMSC